LKSILHIGLIAGLLSVFVLVFLFSPVHIIQTSYAQVNSTLETYENPKFGLTLTYPSTWSVEELRDDPDNYSDNSIVAIFKTEEQGPSDKYLENIIINVQGPRSDIKSLESYTRNSIQAFNDQSDISIIKSGKNMLAGYPAHVLEYTSTGIPGLNLKKFQVFTVIDNIAYIVTFGAEQSQYDKNIPIVEKVISTIKIDRSAI
jgi:eukaryotic-like serine/threonine-protein kinase